MTNPELPEGIDSAEVGTMVDAEGHLTDDPAKAEIIEVTETDERGNVTHTIMTRNP